MIDFDASATTPLRPEVAAAMAEQLRAAAGLGNPSSLHRRGQAARAVLETARRQVAASVGATPLELTFTSGGTEADALGLVGVVRARRAVHGLEAVVAAPFEHAAVEGALAVLAAEGHPVVRCAHDGRGALTSELLADALERAATQAAIGAVTFVAVHHELGHVHDVPALVAVVRRLAPGAHVHVDAVQALGKVAVSRAAWGCDSLAVSAHKIHGPPGIGALAHRQGLQLQPLWAGGAHERGRRPGTEAWLLAHAFAAAATLAASERAVARERWLATRAHLRRGLERLREAGAPGFAELVIHGPAAEAAPDALAPVLSLSLPGYDGQMLVAALDLEGFATATGAACSSGVVSASPVVLGLGYPRRVARGTLRLSWGSAVGEADVDALIAALARVVARGADAAAMEATA